MYLGYSLPVLGWLDKAFADKDIAVARLTQEVAREDIAEHQFHFFFVRQCCIVTIHRAPPKYVPWRPLACKSHLRTSPSHCLTDMTQQIHTAPDRTSFQMEHAQDTSNIQKNYHKSSLINPPSSGVRRDPTQQPSLQNASSLRTV